MNEKLTWRLSEVLAYLEDKIISGIASEDEQTMYENYKWNNKINRKSATYKQLVMEMSSEYLGGY